MNKLKNKKVALALGGGAVLGAAHIGVIKALEEFGVEIKAISGTSAGAIVASLYAFGKSVKEIEKIVLEFEWKNLSSLTLSKYGVLSNEKIGEMIKLNIGDKTFKEAKIPLAMIATDITNGDKVVLDKGSVADAVMASTCIPGIFVPIELDGRFLVDGGVVENIPLSCLKKEDVDILMGVDLVPEKFYKKPENVIDVLYNSFTFLVKINKKFQIKDADIIIKPDLCKFNPVEMSQIKDLIEAGYNETKKIITTL
ncbi:MAG: patatin [Sulfurimonas sp. RIFOXYD12_FULL_33_39]|uniref:patatin-like phospholipase family protein n=1 Tax=unclassified Sulfurimonas TaxID=2623549 RepID=UPI0008CB06F9|nr:MULTISPECIES: patatin-like phospholipase family protein [unclassified Sulfurimonas]OHE01555.1 MAG: patatin [Sulfurimonas sp. RIFCSPLOWO2_12_FULL_34_6]OHE10012.1 MAG: patatin [Sulfurimonas sp. RIFOXYD12_FULL_33_39]OHE14768.1 MAG: patatin [Sulfurimonas sp. RIFOXYD2_FULL_34_21]